MGRSRCSYPLVVSFFVFLILGPAVSAYAGVYKENRCYHKANRAEKSVRKLERKESKACTRRYSDNVDYSSVIEVQNLENRNACWREAEQNRASRLGIIDDVRSECLGAAGGEALTAGQRMALRFD